MSRNPMSVVRSAVRGARRFLLELWAESQRTPPDANDYLCGQPIDAEQLAFNQRYYLATRAGQSGSIVRATGGHYRAIATDSPRAGLSSADRARFTLTAIQRAKSELEAQGFTPTQIILQTEEAKCVLRENFNWSDRLDFPRSIEIMGLPVKVQD